MQRRTLAEEGWHVGADAEDVEVVSEQRRIGHRNVADGAEQHLVLGVEATQQAAVALGQIGVVGDDDEDHPASEVARGVVEQHVEVRRQPGRVDRVVDRAQDPLEVDVARRRGHVDGAGGVAHRRRRRAGRAGEQPDEVAVAGRELGDDAGGEHGDVALGARRVGERRHRPAGVDDEHARRAGGWRRSA